MDSFLKMIFSDNFVHGDLHPGNLKFRQASNDSRQLELVVLDAGLAVQLSPQDRRNFVAGVGELVSSVWGVGLALGNVRLGEIFGKMLGLACYHRVKLETSFVTVATSIIVLEGVGRQLNPVTDLAAAARPLLAEAVARRIWEPRAQAESKA